MNIFTHIWRFIFGDPKPKEIWKTEREEYLRREEEYTFYPHSPIDYYDVYAIHQVSITTGNKRIYEERRLA